ncbi:MAG: molybdopterin-dependent oxidoreductase [Acidimicrobiales bacterium]|nr:molybdopterin-dependent oxidoreductase [Acidimicrobiales bacterium]
MTPTDEHAPADPTPAPWRPPGWWGAAAGLAAVAAALAAGELATGFAASLRNPVVSVGDRVIDAAPRPVKDVAIDTFGTNDKPALITGTLLILIALAVVAGVATVRRRLAVGLGIVAGFGLLGMAAATFGRNGTGNGWVPSLLAMVAAGGTLVLFHRVTYPPVRIAPAGVATATGTALAGAASRRQFLGALGGIGVGAAVLGSAGRRLSQRFSADLERAGVRPRTPAEPLAAPPADPAAGIEGLSPLFVANDDFYRIDTALVAPRVTTDGWALTIDGRVDRPLRLTYDELWNRTLVEYDVTLSCVSNQVGGDLVGNARWIGVRLDELLEEAGVQPGADQVMTHSVDGFTAGFPVRAALDGRDAIVALAMNGTVLPVAHGYPARLVVPGLYGYVSATKWLSRIELTRFDEAQGYWIPRGWAVEAPVKTQSRIDTPRRSRDLRAGRLPIAGVAWAPGRAIREVEVQIDDGDWQQAELGPELADTSWRQWWLAWDATPGEHTLRCRATDGTGTTQTEQRSRPDPDGATGWHSVQIEVGPAD